jgi:hypothetical protein
VQALHACAVSRTLSESSARCSDGVDGGGIAGVVA